MRRNPKLRQSLGALAVLIACLCAMSAVAHAQPRIQHSVFGSGGGPAISRGGATMQGTVGQPMTGRAANDQVSSANGFWYLWGGLPVATSVDNDPPAAGQLPLSTKLHPNAPNPFNPSTTIHFDLAREGSVRLELFDLRGRRVDVMIDGWMAAGEHQLVYRPRRLSSGTYFYRLVTPDAELTRRMVLVR